VEWAGETGWFAIASPPGEARFEFYVQSGGGSSEGLLGAPVGSALQVGVPQGEGYGLDAALAEEAPIYLLAAGSGYSGVRACLAQLRQRGRGARIYVGARTEADLLFRSEYGGLRAAGIEVVEVLSRPADQWAGRRGYVQAALEADVSTLAGAWVIGCGPADMQTQAHALCVRLGLSPDRFLTNY
jgi:CDP-4-dehydro-6-deoxyglucose reductase